MSPELQSLQLFLTAALGFLALGSLATAALLAVIKPALALWEPRSRHRVLVLLALLPWGLAALLWLAAALPSALALLQSGVDHCPVHDDGHAHLCFVHLPHLPGNPAPLLAMVFLSAYLAIRLALAAAAILRPARLATALLRSAHTRRNGDVAVVAGDQPLCVAVGLLRPQVLISRGLIDCLSAADLAVVIAHERAHVRRRDALTTALMRVLAVAQLPWVGPWLLRELAIAAEQACDEEAGRVAGDRLAVAAAILAVARAAEQAPAAPFGSFALAAGTLAVERRVEGLLQPSAGAVAALWPWLAAFFGLALALGWAADELHHAAESLLSALVY